MWLFKYNLEALPQMLELFKYLSMHLYILFCFQIMSFFRAQASTTTTYLMLATLSTIIVHSSTRTGSCHGQETNLGNILSHVVVLGFGIFDSSRFDIHRQDSSHQFYCLQELKMHCPFSCFEDNATQGVSLCIKSGGVGKYTC